MDKENTMLTVFQKIGELDERTKKTDKDLSDFQKSIDKKLKDIDDKIETELTTVNTKLDTIIHAQHRQNGGKKMLGWIFSGLIVFAGFLAWIIDRWDSIRIALF